MNMNYDLMTWIEYFVGAFACCFFIFLSGKYLLDKKFNDLKFYNWLLLIPFSIILILNSLAFDNIMKVFGTLAVFFCIYMFSLKTKLEDAFLYSIATCLIFLLGEVTFALIISLIDLFFDTTITSGVIKSYYSNIMIAIFSYVYTIIFKRIIVNNIKKINKNNELYFLLLGTITIFVILSSIYKLYLNNWTIDYKFVLNIIIIVGCLILILVLLKQYLKNKEIMDKYILLEDYLKTSADLVEKHSSTIHKYKNNLIAIKGYLKSDIKEANNYIDTLLENYKTKKYSWFSKLNYIKIDIVRYLVYCKLSKAEALNLKISVDVSSNVKKFSNNELTVYEINTLSDIIGEYFDNAIYASNESKEKEINFVLYLENDKLIFVLANTYKEKVALSLITKNGYTTKGKNHGFGLYDIDKTLKSIPCFEVKYELLDNYFVVSLTISKI